jgi:ATP-binding cassette subfamily B protein
VRRVLALLRPYRVRAALAALASLVQGALAIAPALAVKRLIEELTAAQPSFGVVLAALVIALAGVLLGSLAGVLVTWLTTTVAQGVVADLRAALFAHLVGQTVGYHTRARQGDLLSRVLNDVAGVQSAIETTVVGIVRNACVAVAVSVVMLVLDWRLALVTFLVVPMLGLPLRLAGRATARARGAVQEQYGELTAYLQETLGLSGVMLVRAFGRQAAEIERFGALNAELRRRQLRAAMTARWFGVAVVALTAMAPTAILLVGGALVSSGSASLSTVLVFATVIVVQLGAAVQGLATAGVTVLGSRPLWQRIFAVLDEPSEVVERADAIDPPALEGAIRLEDVTFRYPGQLVPAVSGVSVEIAPGQTVAIVGPSGAGKTTLSALVARFADPESGRVLLDGIDARDLTLASLGRAIGVVFQDPFLFHTSLRENLRFGRPDATDAELADAAQDAQLLDVVRALPEGWDTIVGERGHRLSGGEKQRVALARALLKDPRVLVLDEATAHLDAISERAMQAALAAATRGRTSLVIAHRLSTVRDADLILVLDHGILVERGTHDELLAAGGLYARMHDGHLDLPEQAPR